MGPLVSKEQHERVLGYIEAGKRDGASVLMGGDVPSNEGGYYVNATILTDVNPQMSVVREEIFGPVVVAQRFEDLDDVVDLAGEPTSRQRAREQENEHYAQYAHRPVSLFVNASGLKHCLLFRL